MVIQANYVQIRQDMGRFRLEAFEAQSPSLRRNHVRLRLSAVAPRVDELLAASQNRLKPSPRWGTPIRGEVVEWGSGVVDMREGDLMMGISTLRTLPGVIPEYLSVPRHQLIHCPSHTPEDSGHAALSDMLMSFTSLRDSGQVKVGQRILVLAPTSAPGRVGIQTVRIMGGEAIVTTLPEHVGRLRSLGASEVWELSLDTLMERLNEIHVVYDPMGISHLAEIKPCLVAGGRYVSPVIGLRRTLDQIWSQAAGRLLGGQHVSRLVERRIEARDLELASRYVEDGMLSVDIVESIPLRALLDTAISKWAQSPFGRLDITLS